MTGPVEFLPLHAWIPLQGAFTFWFFFMLGCWNGFVSFLSTLLNISRSCFPSNLVEATFRQVGLQCVKRLGASQTEAQNIYWTSWETYFFMFSGENGNSVKKLPHTFEHFTWTLCSSCLNNLKWDIPVFCFLD